MSRCAWAQVSRTVPVIRSAPCEPLMSGIEDRGAWRGLDPIMRNYALNAKGNFQFDRVITGWRNRPVLDNRLKK